MNRRMFVVTVVALVLSGMVLSAFVFPPQRDEDRPPIIVSSGSVIISVARGSWVGAGAGRFGQELPNGRDVKSFSATTGAGAAACTVTGGSIVVTYGTSTTIRFERTMPAVAQRNRTDVVLPATAKVTARDARTLEIATTDALVSFSNGGTNPGDTCKVVASRLEIRQVH